MNSHRRPSGVTLIELLIVLGILLILLGAAIGNYQSTSVRAKVARVFAEHRELSSAISVYAVDHNRYPRMAHAAFYGDPALDVIGGQKVSGVLSNVLSTPVAYTSYAHLSDPFAATTLAIDEKLYTYQHIAVYCH
jgi:prepilin-type N-terminal cleavage/methylation domain-containing protein